MNPVALLPALASVLVMPSAAPFDQSARTIDDLLALGRPVVLAHNGGETEFPGGTMYAFGRSVEAGVDVLDLNVQLSADGVLVVLHDLTVDRTTETTGAVKDMTYAALAELDNAYWFTETCEACPEAAADDYVLRGIRSGDVTPPTGYTPDDFGIPRLEDVLEAYPDIPLSIEIKDVGDPAKASVDVLIPVLQEYGRLDGVVLASFDNGVVEYIHEVAPDVDVSPLAASALYLMNGTPLPDYVRIVQPPAYVEDTPIATGEAIAAAHDDGLVVWLWPNDGALENADAYTVFLAAGMDGLNINYPALAIATVDAQS